MSIIVTLPAGPRAAVLPFPVVSDEVTLVKALLLTLALERRIGAEEVSLDINLGNVDADRLLCVVRLFGQLKYERQTSVEISPLDANPVPDTPPPMVANARAEATHALRILDALQVHILGGGEPLRGYAAAASLVGCGEPGAVIRDSCLRIDLAAYESGLPLLALNWVRKSDGAIDREAFPLPWQVYRQMRIDRMSIHIWDRNDFTSLRQSLQRLPLDISASDLWKKVDATRLQPAAGTWRRWNDPGGVLSSGEGS